MSWSTSEIRVRLALWNRFKPSSKIILLCLLTVPRRYFFCGLFLLYVLCVSYLGVCSLLPCGHLLGKDWPLSSCLWCLIVFLSLSHWQRKTAVSGSSPQLTLKKGAPGDQVWDLLCLQLASYLERGPLMWMMPLHLHVNQKSDYDDIWYPGSGVVLDCIDFSSLPPLFQHMIVFNSLPAIGDFWVLLITSENSLDPD